MPTNEVAKVTYESRKSKERQFLERAINRKLRIEVSKTNHYITVFDKDKRIVLNGWNKEELDYIKRSLNVPLTTLTN